MRISPILLTATVTALLGATVATAQDISPERVQQELSRTDERIEQAEMIVSGSDYEPARLALAEAVQVQLRAKSEFSSGHLRISLELTLRARDRAARAVALARRAPDPDRVRAQLERTQEVIERARDYIEECNDDRARAVLRAAAEMQSRAFDAFRNERYLAALQLTTSARERGMRALRLCKVQEDLSRGAERSLARTDEVIARAQDHVTESSSERARHLLARAVDLQERAYSEYRAGRLKASLRLTHSARALAHRAIRVTSGRS